MQVRFFPVDGGISDLAERKTEPANNKIGALFTYV